VARDTRDRLLSAAWTIIEQHGVGAATSRRITDAAGANLAAITYHFGSKDALIGEAVVQRLRAWTAPLTDALAGDATDVDEHDARVAAAVAAILGRLAANPHEVEPILTLLLAHPELPAARSAAVAWLTELRAIATDVMVRQQAAGLVPDTVDPPVMAAVFTAFALGMAAQAKLDPEAPPIPATVAQFLSLLTRPPR
jgi:AcrR family transcriptional regulator